MTVGTAWQRVAAVLGPVLVVLGAIGVMVGVLQMLDAAGDVLEEVAVPVRLTTSDGLGADLALDVGGEPFDGVRVSGVPAGGAPDTDPRSDPLGIVVIHAPDASLGERFLSRADVLVRGAAVLVAAVALLPLLRAIARTAELGADAGRRLRVVALCVIVGGYVAPLLPWWATASVLGRLDGVHGMSAAPPHHLQAFVVAALVGLLAALLDGRDQAAAETA
ncbi:hypothetical protein [Actinotalea subterranea]|uniref:hypothetical protein n=1 Tax=Actinotalea subterranea TaxID=2607497 RepID=UPI0011ED928F|nr:hypothetical protein [Actinotalea subterranea]